MDCTQDYHIGSAGQKWGESERKQWLSEQQIKRSYEALVLSQLEQISEQFELVKYGNLDYENHQYPLFVIKSKYWNDALPNILITGGVHGYETSGVHGAVQFILNDAVDYHEQYNFIIAPCVSPWGYETINRWNPDAIDPNRSFYSNSPAQESALLMGYIDKLNIYFACHIDLHETTDTDNSEFRPALIARDAKTQQYSAIPDGFYLVGDMTKPASDFQKAIIDQVKTITHIAPADEQNCLIGAPMVQIGVVNYAARELGLCMGLTDAHYVTTTEVYPDSPLVDAQNCIDAQVAVICAALNFIKKR